MKNYDSHIILYAKGWYQKFNPIKDMQILLAERSGFDEIEYITISNIFDVLSHMIYPYINNEHLFSEFISNIIHYKWDMRKEMSAMENFIQACMDILSELQVYETVRNKTGGFDVVKELIELDEPDYRILPKRRED